MTLNNEGIQEIAIPKQANPSKVDTFLWSYLSRLKAFEKALSFCFNR